MNGLAVKMDNNKNLQRSPSATIDKLLEELAQGTNMVKIKSSTKHYARTYYLDRNRLLLCYEGSTKMFHSNIIKRELLNIKLARLHDIRDGKKEFSKRLTNVDKSCLICLVFGVRRHKVVYLVAPSVELKDKWIQGIQFLIQSESLAVRQKQQDKWIKDAFKMADKNNDGGIDLQECVALVKKMNAHADKAYVRKLFDEANTNRTQVKGKKQDLDEGEFVQFYLKLTKRNEVQEIFNRYAASSNWMTCEEFLYFMRTSQHMQGITEAVCSQLIVIYEPSEENKSQSLLSIHGFQNFLRSPEQMLFNYHHTRIYQNMEQPLHHYYINSSHNTYLLSDQLKGPSSTEAYIQALKRGCRCVELDCWDGPGGEPVIYHGHTLTSKIKFEDVINVINEYAFDKSPYPLILSFENHCSIEQQTRMAEILKTILGDQIFTAREHELKSMPSPDDLKRRIIIKCKKLPPNITGTGDDDVTDEDEAAEMTPDAQTVTKIAKKLKLSTHLSDLVSVSRSVRFKGFDDALSNAHFAHICSLNETKCERLIRDEGDKFARHTYNWMVRTYPAGTRTDSSNYNPVPMWSVGCQIVALNFQTSDEAMHLNHGRYLHNGQCGYVLKPGILLSGNDSTFNPHGPFDPSWKRTLEIRIISGYQIPKPKERQKGEIIDPFIKLEVFGVASDNQSVQTTYVEDNGLNPVYNETFFLEVNVPQVAMLKFTVMDYDEYSSNDFIGFYSMPFTSLQQGFRQFHLCNKYGIENKKSLILVHCTIHKGDHTLSGTPTSL